ncbi:MAG: DUF4238 domain-containing protein [Chloroflexi bacterium]|nr:DUF4238 domain-containing protein [Chloroflexota bacterium]
MEDFSAHEQARWNEPILGLTNAKRQHYVPQMYLRHFSREDGSIRIHDINKGTEFLTSMKNIAVETGFYDFPIEDTIVSTETWLSQIEGAATQTIQRLGETPDYLLKMSLEEEIHLARFTGSLFFRTPFFRSELQRMFGLPLPQIREIIKGQLYSRFEKREADKLWEEWKDKPDYWWWGMTDPPNPAEDMAIMFSEVQGFANLLLAMPWRIGYVPNTMRLYTSDTPVSRFLPSVRPWYYFGGFTHYDYYWPVSSKVLLLVKGRSELQPRGLREVRDFSPYATSIAQHVISQEATRYIFGDGLVVSRKCAISCLADIEKAKLEFAIKYLGFKNTPPPFPPK